MHRRRDVPRGLSDLRVEVVPRKRNLPEPVNGSTLPTMVGAVIYVRVSTKEQTENLSLPTQLRACEEYCRRQGYEILERFHEEGESAKTTDRSQLQNLLTFCRLNKGRVHFVVVFNLTRFARDKYDHFALRSYLQSLGISLRSATEPIDDTSTGKLMEGVLAAFAQFDNDCRSDRTRAGMKAALELGRWVFLAPIGYLNAPRAMGKSLLHGPRPGRSCGGHSRSTQTAVHEAADSAADDVPRIDQSPGPAGGQCSTCLFANARPEPVFR
jgi:DNA invertase Pin-like site-specific DNA recombinase